MGTSTQGGIILQSYGNPEVEKWWESWTFEVDVINII